MEVAGLAISVLSLVSLCDSCVKLIERLESFHRFERDRSPLLNQLEANRLILQDWSRRVSTKDHVGSTFHHTTLDSKRIEVVYKLLFNLRDILSTSLPPQLDKDREPGNGTNSLPPPALSPRGSRTTVRLRDQFKWAFGGGRGKLQHQLQLSTDLIQKLQQLVPVESNPYHSSGGHVYNVSSWSSMFDGPGVHPFGLPRTSQDKFGGQLQYFQQDIANLRDLKTGELRDWLSVVPFEGLYRKRISERHTKTCLWLQNEDYYMEWLSMDDTTKGSQILWLYGPGGCGKSVLCASTVEQLLDAKKELVYFFCTSDSQEHRNTVAIIVAFIWQLAMFSDITFSNLLRWKEKVWPQKPSEDDLWDFFERAISNAIAPILAIDGFDECQRFSADWKDGQDSVRMMFLNKLSQRTKHCRVRVILFSREESDIRSGVMGFKDNENDCILHTHRIITPDVQSDLALFAQTTVQSRLPGKPDETKDTIVERLIHQSDGMFLWIKLQGTALRDTKNRNQLIRMAEEMPYGLENLYTRKWSHIQELQKEERERAQSILMWLAFAVRPLTVLELTEALALLDEDEVPDSMDDEYIQKEILDLCASLITVEEVAGQLCGSSVVTFSHFSAKTFVLNTVANQPRHLSVSLNEDVIAQSCIHYLMNKFQWQDISSSDALPSPTFLDYVVQNWHKHLSTKPRAAYDRVTQLVNNFFSLANESWSYWRDRYEMIEQQQLTDRIQFSYTHGGREYYSSFFNLVPTMAYIEQEQKGDWNSEGGFYGSPLQAACANGLSDGVEFLLDQKVDVNQRGGVFGCALNAAAEKGACAIMLRLIDAGADVQVEDHLGQTALHFAAQKGHIKAVKLILDRVANINVVDNSKWTPLARASDRGHVDVARLLLIRGADTNIPDLTGRPPLIHAAHHGHIEVVKLLLDYGANIDTSDDTGNTPLICAADVGHLEVVNFLLSQGAGVNAANDHGSTPLVCASGRGHVNVAKILLEQGADVDIIDHQGLKPLGQAALAGYTEIVQLLLDRDANVDIVDCGQWVPLSRASDGGHAAVVTLLLDRGANINTIDDEGWTALAYASYSGHAAVVKLLLDRGANVGMAGDKGRTPLASASYQGHVSVVDLLLDRGADINKVDNDGWTPLSCAVLASQNRTETVELLLENGADVYASDGDGETALCTAILQADLEVTRMLLQKMSQDQSQSLAPNVNLMRHAMCSSSPEVRDTVIAHGYNMSFVDSAGRNALHTSIHGQHLSYLKTEVDAANLVSQVDSLGCSILHYIVRKSPVAVIKWAIDAGAELSRQDNQGWTPLHWAAYFGHVPAIDCLLKLGAASKILDLEGRSPADIAILMRAEEAVNMLLGTSERYLPHEDSNVLCNDCDIVSFGPLPSLILIDIDKHGQNIYFDQFRCKMCFDFDLCFRCNKDRALLHPGDHEFQQDFGY